MAVKIDGEIVSTKWLKKANKPTKKAKSKSLVWASVYWIDKENYDLWEWKITKEDNLPTLSIYCYNRNINKNPQHIMETMERDISDISFNKQK